MTRWRACSAPKSRIRPRPPRTRPCARGIIARIRKAGRTGAHLYGDGLQHQQARRLPGLRHRDRHHRARSLPGQGKAIILLAHYDSVPAGPGAADDGSGVAAVLETARALRARAAKGAKSLHPVIAVLTDGEEYGLLGADAFLSDPPLRSLVGAVINVEARGNQGQSRLFQTSPAASKLTRSVCGSCPCLRHELSLCRNLQIHAQRHRPDAVPAPRLSEREFRHCRPRRALPHPARHAGQSQPRQPAGAGRQCAGHGARAAADALCRSQGHDGHLCRSVRTLAAADT